MPSCPPARRSFSDERSPGAFLSLGALPKRNPDSISRKAPVFHIAHDYDDDPLFSHDEQSSRAAVPFPRSSSPPSPSSPPSSPPSLSTSRSPSPHPSPPILLSSGKPLKSSLKSSSSSPSIVTDPHGQHTHLRARSEPSSFTAQHKNVHFPEQDYGLATVRIFNRSARPAALSNPAIGDETETEGEDNQPTCFPFPSTPPFHYTLDPAKSSPVPSPHVPYHANIFLESIRLSSSSHSPSSAAAMLVLVGSVLVRNLAFEKHVAVRFTLDDWQTVSEVSARYVDSLSTLPSQIPRHSTDNGDSAHPLEERGWDRFTFKICLEDYSRSLSTRTLWLASRYRVNCTYPIPGSCHQGLGGEWWDNNEGANYRVAFQPALPSAVFPSSRPRRETTPAPIIAPQARPQLPSTSKDHVLGLMVPPDPSHKVPSRAGKLSLSNYAPPIPRPATSITPSSANTPGVSPLPPRLPALQPPAMVRRTRSDEDSSSSSSSTLSTPSVSPIMIPRVIIGGQPATPSPSNDSSENDALRRSRHIRDWDWSAPGKQAIDGLPRRTSDLVSLSEKPVHRQNISTGQRGDQDVNDSKILYNAFVTQWCFAQGPSPNHSYIDGGILA